MNNGKVRIYELSKELNLDNKELLAICDQLSIAVKSHSSTITELDAERIRTAAMKVAITTNVMPKQDRTSQINYSDDSASSPNQVDANKQKILEIRRPPKIQLKDSINPAPEATINKQFLSSEASHPSPPKPFAPPAPSMKPTAPTRPISRENSQDSQPDTVSEEKKNLTQEKKYANQEINNSKGKLEKPKKQQLVSPPSRPSSQKPGKSGQGNLSERPVLKRNRDQSKIQSKSEANHEDISVTPAQKSSRPALSVKPESKGTKSGLEPVKIRPSRSVPSEVSTPVPVLITGPQKSVSTKTEDQDTDDSDVVGESDVLELKRPTPPRLNKVNKKRHKSEEVEEIKESIRPGKGSSSKGKRSKPIVEDDFEDDLLDGEDLDGDDTIQVSNAIVRPPKPKSLKQSQPNTAKSHAAAPLTRGKKSSTPREVKGRKELEIKLERPTSLTITSTMTVQELAGALAVADTEIVKILFLKGMAVSITQNLDIPTITLVANELEIEVEIREPEAEARKVTEMLDVTDLENLQRRPPVVTIMGHVDHGKTTLLDSIRKTKVAAGEAGGITQHIGAYHVDIENNGKTQQIVFLDTPGHEAFTAMRARGARVTDIAILVVAADDGVRPQTIEAISHAQAAKVPIVVAINKIDKEEAQPDRVKQELTKYNLTPEEWGGETIMVPVSAIQGENLDTLLEMLLLVSEVEELSANPNRPAKGTVIEAHLDKAKGAVATLLIQNGTLSVGDLVVAGPVFGKVRAMVNDHGYRVDKAYPSFAVEVLGLSDVPAAGDEFDVFQNEKEGRTLAAQRTEKQRLSRLLQGGRVTLTSISAQAQEGDLKELNLILKADVQGSIEAIVGSLKQIPQNEVQLRLLLASAGEITQTDIDLAAASGAVIVGFNTTYASGSRHAADEAGVDVREYNIIYKLLEDIQDALEGLLEPELIEETLGQAEVRAVFAVGKGAVAGCYVQSGKLLRNCRVRIMRNGALIHENALDSLKRIKDDVKEVNAGYECGVGIDKYTNWEQGDMIEAFQMVTQRRTLSVAK
ncbi:Translation initiation factor 2 [Richelia intracellularis HH01]|uniref:Translation initiation factor IF-2 n=1 Tax=Richelia intracellularis HH01 TaxID=1165094 RepID=M1X2J7_9NOST|nr:translation initiation factor IF-2 [Richelia intracellularis]CCH66945.1 Translation initiation factor 2 [Richelia intracellularis HH01]HAE05778.1 translation initiation factor IF-2 [Richelia sp.]